VPVGLLKSNLTYTISISDGITDPSGNKMTFAVTTNFTTVDYTEPRVIATTPATSQVIGDGTTFYLRFNKAIDGSVFAGCGSGTLRLEQLSGNHGTPEGSPLPISAFADPASASTLVVAPVGEIGKSFYLRELLLTFSLSPQKLSVSLPPLLKQTGISFNLISTAEVPPVGPAHSYGRVDAAGFGSGLSSDHAAGVWRGRAFSAAAASRAAG
jgi:hypothetical protein